MLRKILSVLLSFVFAINCFSLFAFADSGTVYYVSPDGDDSNSGTSEHSAWKTLQRASAETYDAGDKILLERGGIFNDTFIARGNGTAGNPIALGSYGDESEQKPVIHNDDETALIMLSSVSGWTVDGIEFTDENGRGIHIYAGENCISRNISIKNCDFYNFLYVPGKGESRCRFPILINSAETGRIRNLTISGCSFTKCGYGIVMDGVSREWSADLYKNPAESYNSDFIFENLSFNDILYDAVIVMSVSGIVIRNSSFINCAMDTTSATAAVWSHHTANMIVENCEIAGSANYHDGMAVDFDGWTTDSTYQYIYSHDNQRFINNCCYDGWTRNSGCTVRYCLSVNDNKCKNSMAQIMYSPSLEYAEGEMSDYMDNFKFYNNTIINMGEMEINNLHNSVIANNIFVGSGFSYFDYAEKHIDDETGGPLYEDFDGVFTNNCLCGVAVPYLSENNFICEPGFAGNDETDINSFKLSSDSRLIGRGIKADDDMGLTDFYGNELGENHNIGCYEGTGEETGCKADFVTALKHNVYTLISTIRNLIETCNRRFWIF